MALRVALEDLQDILIDKPRGVRVGRGTNINIYRLDANVDIKFVMEGGTMSYEEVTDTLDELIVELDTPSRILHPFSATITKNHLPKIQISGIRVASVEHDIPAGQFRVEGRIYPMKPITISSIGAVIEQAKATWLSHEPQNARVPRGDRTIYARDAYLFLAFTSHQFFMTYGQLSATLDAVKQYMGIHEIHQTYTGIITPGTGGARENEIAYFSLGNMRDVRDLQVA
ncbi:MAG: hypothetical protein LQ342_002263 [Letrouitia transgressa]|nr:MAG: hypothetical protein LQ342_002263 [Letrouitia transgressa]